MSGPRRAAGFTLLELMIAVAIVGILAVIAIPSYRSYLIRANRADAQQTLLRAAQGFERYAVTNGAAGYAGATLSNIAVSSPVTQSPASGTAVYNMTSVATATTFTITATPSPTSINKTDGNLTLNQTGAKGGNWSR